MKSESTKKSDSHAVQDSRPAKTGAAILKSVAPTVRRRGRRKKTQKLVKPAQLPLFGNSAVTDW